MLAIRVEGDPTRAECDVGFTGGFEAWDRVDCAARAGLVHLSLDGRRVDGKGDGRGNFTMRVNEDPVWVTPALFRGRGQLGRTVPSRTFGRGRGKFGSSGATLPRTLKSPTFGSSDKCRYDGREANHCRGLPQRRLFFLARSAAGPDVVFCIFQCRQTILQLSKT